MQLTRPGALGEARFGGLGRAIRADAFDAAGARLREAPGGTPGAAAIGEAAGA